MILGSANSVAASWIILIATRTKVHLLLKVLIMCIIFDSGEDSLIMILLFSRPRPVGGDSSPPGFHPDTLAPPPPKEDQLVIGMAKGYQLICLEDGQQVQR